MERSDIVSSLRKNHGIHISTKDNPCLDLILREIVSTYPRSASLEILNNGTPVSHLSVYKQSSGFYLISPRNDIVQIAKGVYFKVIPSDYHYRKDKIPILIRRDEGYQLRIDFRKYEPKSS